MVARAWKWDDGRMPSIAKGGVTMVTDKSLFYYGSIYHAIIDPLIKPSVETDSQCRI